MGDQEGPPLRLTSLETFKEGIELLDGFKIQFPRFQRLHVSISPEKGGFRFPIGDQVQFVMAGLHLLSFSNTV